LRPGHAGGAGSRGSPRRPSDLRGSRQRATVTGGLGHAAGHALALLQPLIVLAQGAGERARDGAAVTLFLVDPTLGIPKPHVAALYEMPGDDQTGHAENRKG